MLTESKINRSARVMFGPHPVEVCIIRDIFAALPKDAIMYGHIHDPDTGQFGWIVASMEFKEIEAGESLPKIVAKIDVDKVVDLMSETSFADELGSL